MQILIYCADSSAQKGLFQWGPLAVLEQLVSPASWDGECSNLPVLHGTDVIPLIRISRLLLVILVLHFLYFSKRNWWL